MFAARSDDVPYGNLVVKGYGHDVSANTHLPPSSLHGVVGIENIVRKILGYQDIGAVGVRVHRCLLWLEDMPSCDMDEKGKRQPVPPDWVTV